MDFDRVYRARYSRGDRLSLGVLSAGISAEDCDGCGGDDDCVQVRVLAYSPGNESVLMRFWAASSCMYALSSLVWYDYLCLGWRIVVSAVWSPHVCPLLLL